MGGALILTAATFATLLWSNLYNYYMCSINHDMKAIYIHIHKTGGTTISMILKKYYGFKNYYLHRPDHDKFCFNKTRKKYINYENEQDYASKSIDYVNNEVWGNLGVAVLIKNHNSRKNKELLNSYVQNLNYGTVAINEWPALGFIIPTMPWGGYPGNKDSDIQSGQGYVHNALFFESPLKGVLYSKFKLPLIDPVWFTSNKKGRKVFKNLTYYQIENSKINLIKLLFSALI